MDRQLESQLGKKGRTKAIRSLFDVSEVDAGEGTPLRSSMMTDLKTVQDLTQKGA
jgi:hypothetical protein